MKKLLAVLAIAALSSVVARAEDKGTEFKFGGEIRERFTYDNNPSFLNTGAINDNNWLQRNIFHVNAVSSDKLQGYVSLLNYSVWGAGGGVPPSTSPYAGTTNGAVPAPNAANGTANNVNTGTAVQVFEAWVWWKVSDMFSIRAGRQAVEYGDGLVFSKNDWNANPYTVDGLMGRFSWDFLDLDVGGGKLLDLGAVPAGGNTTDSEIDFYGLYASFKNLPDFLKKAEVFALQINADPNGFAAGSFAPFAPSMAGTSNWNLTSYGLHLKGDVTNLDYRADAVFQSGKQKGVAGGADTTFGGNMFDVQVGWTFPEFMKARVWADYHQDSGAGTGTNTNNQYQPLFYDTHSFTGLANVFGWGNLTNISFGLTLAPMEDSWLGLDVNLLSRTEGSSPYTGLLASSSGMFTLPAAASTDKALGTEVDLWAKHNYGHGFSMLAQLGYITLGNYYKPTGGTAPGNGYQFVAQAQYNF